MNKPGSGARLSGITATQQVPAPSAITGTDQLELSDQARLLSFLEDDVEQLPVIDMTKVETLREAIQSGKMPVDRELLAKKIQQFESFLQDIDS